jgi:hypothetical protein
MKIEMEELKLTDEWKKKIKEAEEKGDKSEVKKLNASHKKSLKTLSAKKNQHENEEEILFFTIPQKVEGLSGIFTIGSGSTYNYAIGTRGQTDEVMKEGSDKDTPKKDLADLSQEKGELMGVDQFKGEKIEDKSLEMKKDMSVDKPKDDSQKKEEADMSIDKPKEDNSQEQAGSQEQKMDISHSTPKEAEEKDVSNTETEKKEEVPKPAENNQVEEVKEKIEEKKADEHKENPNLNVVYSWGIANSFVLGNANDENSVYKPLKVEQSMYKGKNPVEVSWGTLHVVIKAINSDEKLEHFDLEESVREIPQNFIDELKSESKAGKKRKRENSSSLSKRSKGCKLNIISLHSFFSKNWEIWIEHSLSSSWFYILEYFIILAI